MNSPTTKKCPYCAEEILVDAVKCKHCGSMLEAAAPFTPMQATPDVPDSTLESYWYWIIWGSLLIPAGVWIVVILSSVMYYAWKGNNPEKANAINRQGWLAFLASHVLWGAIWCGLSAAAGGS